MKDAPRPCEDSCAPSSEVQRCMPLLGKNCVVFEKQKATVWTEHGSLSDGRRSQNDNSKPLSHTFAAKIISAKGRIILESDQLCALDWQCPGQGLKIYLRRIPIQLLTDRRCLVEVSHVVKDISQNSV